MGLLLLSTIAYLPLVATVVLNIIVPARRRLASEQARGSSDVDASRVAGRQTLVGVSLIFFLTLGQGGVMAYSLHDVQSRTQDAHPGFILARQTD